MKQLLLTTIAAALSVGVVGVIAESESKVLLMHTPDGIEFGIWGNTKRERPAPTLIVLATTIENTLNSAYYRHCGNQLAKRGYLCISINLPCHGDQRVDGEPEGLSGWSHRAARGSDFVAEFNNRLSKVLDHLVKQGISDPEKIAACGTSRGGFLALHAAIHDPRVKCVAGFAPVTDVRPARIQINQRMPTGQGVQPDQPGQGSRRPEGLDRHWRPGQTGGHRSRRPTGKGNFQGIAQTKVTQQGNAACSA